MCVLSFSKHIYFLFDPKPPPSPLPPPPPPQFVDTGVKYPSLDLSYAAGRTGGMPFVSVVSVVVCCSVLHSVAVCYRDAACRVGGMLLFCWSMLQYVGVCCSMLQYVAECCRMLQYVAVCCSMLQYVAVCCSMLQYVAVTRYAVRGCFCSDKKRDRERDKNTLNCHYPFVSPPVFFSVAASTCSAVSTSVCVRACVRACVRVCVRWCMVPACMLYMCVHTL